MKKKKDLVFGNWLMSSDDSEKSYKFLWSLFKIPLCVCVDHLHFAPVISVCHFSLVLWWWEHLRSNLLPNFKYIIKYWTIVKYSWNSPLPRRETEVAGFRFEQHLTERDDRGWDGLMASPTRWTWVWASSRSWVGHNCVTELNWAFIN